MAHRLHRMELRMVAHFEASRLEVHPKEMNKKCELLSTALGKFHCIFRLKMFLDSSTT